MINLNKDTEAILQNVERFDLLVLEPKYQNPHGFFIISTIITPVAVGIISNNIWHSNSQLETYDRNIMVLKCEFVALQNK